VSNHHPTFVGRVLFLAFVLWSVQIMSAAQIAPQSEEQPKLESVDYDDVPLKSALEGLVRSTTKFDVVFDDSVKNSKITIEMKDVTVKQVIEAILEKKELQVKLKDDKTLFIFADTPENREKYAEMKSWL
jgi:hypothetical protein